MNHVFHVCDYSAPLPEIMYLDTCFIYEIYGNDPDSKHKQDCYNFSNRLVANKVIMAVSHIAIEELEHVIIKGIYEKRAKERNTNWSSLLKKSSEFMPEVNLELNRVMELLSKNPSVVECPVTMDNEFAILRRGLITTYGMDTRDAGHIICAHQNASNSIATIDYDFHKVPDINIFSSNSKYFDAATNQPNSLLPPSIKLSTLAS